MKRLLVCSIGGEFSTKKSGIKKLILRCIWQTGKRLGHRRVLDRINKITERSAKNKKKHLGCRAWVCHLTKEVLPAEVFGRYAHLTLRGREFPVPAGYVTYLDSLYGDWREDLPLEDQHSNHDIKVWWKNGR